MDKTITTELENEDHGIERAKKHAEIQKNPQKIAKSYEYPSVRGTYNQFCDSIYFR